MSNNNVSPPTTCHSACLHSNTNLGQEALDKGCIKSPASDSLNSDNDQQDHNIVCNLVNNLTPTAEFLVSGDDGNPLGTQADKPNPKATTTSTTMLNTTTEEEPRQATPNGQPTMPFYSTHTPGFESMYLPFFEQQQCLMQRLLNQDAEREQERQQKQELHYCAASLTPVPVVKHNCDAKIDITWPEKFNATDPTKLDEWISRMALQPERVQEG